LRLDEGPPPDADGVPVTRRSLSRAVTACPSNSRDPVTGPASIEYPTDRLETHLETRSRRRRCSVFSVLDRLRVPASLKAWLRSSSNNPLKTCTASSSNASSAPFRGAFVSGNTEVNGTFSVSRCSSFVSVSLCVSVGGSASRVSGGVSRVSRETFSASAPFSSRLVAINASATAPPVRGAAVSAKRVSGSGWRARGSAGGSAGGARSASRSCAMNCFAPSKDLTPSVAAVRARFAGGGAAAGDPATVAGRFSSGEPSVPRAMPSRGASAGAASCEAGIACDSRSIIRGTSRRARAAGARAARAGASRVSRTPAESGCLGLRVEFRRHGRSARAVESRARRVPCARAGTSSDDFDLAAEQRACGRRVEVVRSRQCRARTSARRYNSAVSCVCPEGFRRVISWKRSRQWQTGSLADGDETNGVFASR
jgi:hypothetical protein